MSQTKRQSIFKRIISEILWKVFATKIKNIKQKITGITFMSIMKKLHHNFTYYTAAVATTTLIHLYTTKLILESLHKIHVYLPLSILASYLIILAIFTTLVLTLFYAFAPPHQPLNPTKYTVIGIFITAVAEILSYIAFFIIFYCA